MPEIVVADGDETLSYTEPTDAWWDELIQVVGELELIKQRAQRPDHPV